VTAAENTIATLLVLLAPFGLVYGWVFYFKRMRCEAGSWRNRITVVSMVLVSLAAVLWSVMAILMPRADWGTGTGVGHQMQWIEAWHRPIFRTLLAALGLCMFRRPRLILPIAIGCIGTALFWLFSTMP